MLLLALSEEVPAVDVVAEPVPLWVVAVVFPVVAVVFPVEAVVVLDASAGPVAGPVAEPVAGSSVATPAMIDALTVDVLVGWGLVAGSSQVNMTPGMLFPMNQ